MDEELENFLLNNICLTCRNYMQTELTLWGMDAKVVLCKACRLTKGSKEEKLKGLVEWFLA